jgi:hypothetical protein
MYEVKIELRASGDDVSASFDRVIDAYAELEAACPELLDCAFGFARLSEYHARVDVELTVDADTEDKAWEIGMSSVRSAIHATGAGTPNWDERPSGVVYRVADEDVALIPA